MSNATLVLLCLCFLPQTWSLNQIPYLVGIRLCHILCLANGKCNIESYHQETLVCVTSSRESNSPLKEIAKSNSCGKQGCPLNFRCLTSRRCYHVCVTTSIKSIRQTEATDIKRIIVTSESTHGQIQFHSIDVYKKTVRSILTVRAKKITTLKAYGSDFFWCQSKETACGHARFSLLRAAPVTSLRQKKKLKDLAVDMRRKVIYGAPSPTVISVYSFKWESFWKPLRVRWSIFMIELDSDRRCIYVSNTINSKIEVYALNGTRIFMIDFFVKPIQHLYVDVTGNTMYASQDHFIECLKLDLPLSEKHIRRYRQKSFYKYIRMAAADGVLVLALDRTIKEYRTNGLEWKDTNNSMHLPKTIAVDSPIAMLQVPESKGHNVIKQATTKSSSLKVKVDVPQESVLISIMNKLRGKVYTTLYSMDLHTGFTKSKHYFAGRLISMDMQNGIMHRCQTQPPKIVQTDLSKGKRLDIHISSFSCITITMDWKKNIVYFLKEQDDYMYYFKIWPLQEKIRRKRSMCVSRRVGNDVTIFTDKLLHHLYVYKHGYQRVGSYSYSGRALPSKRLETPADHVVYTSQDNRFYFTTINPHGVLRSGMFAPKDKLVHFLPLIIRTPVTGFAVTKCCIVTVNGSDFEVHSKMSSKRIKKGHFKWKQFQLHSLDQI